MEFRNKNTPEMAETFRFVGSLMSNNDSKITKKGDVQAEYERISRGIVGKRDSLEIQQDMISILRLFYTRARICLRNQKTQQGLKLRRIVKSFITIMHFKGNEINLLMENPSYEELMALYLTIYIDLLFLPSGKESVSQLCGKMISFVKMILGHSVPHIVDVLLQLRHLSQHKIWDLLLPLLENIVGMKSPKRTPELYVKTIILIKHWLKNCSRDNRKEVKKLVKKIVAPMGIGQWLQCNELQDLATILKETSMPTTKLLLSKRFFSEAYKKLHRDLKLTTKYNHLLREERIVSDETASDVFKVGAFFIDTLPDRTGMPWGNDFGVSVHDGITNDEEEVVEVMPEPDSNDVIIQDVLSNEISAMVGANQESNKKSPEHHTPKKKKPKTSTGDFQNTFKAPECEFPSQPIVNDSDEVILLNGTSEMKQASPKKSPQKKEFRVVTPTVVNATQKMDIDEQEALFRNEMRKDGVSDEVVVKVNGLMEVTINSQDEKINNEILTPVNTEEKRSSKKSGKIQTRSGSSVADDNKRWQNQAEENACQTAIEHRDPTDDGKISNRMESQIACKRKIKENRTKEPAKKLKRNVSVENDSVCSSNKYKRFSINKHLSYIKGLASISHTDLNHTIRSYDLEELLKPSQCFTSIKECHVKSPSAKSHQNLKENSLKKPASSDDDDDSISYAEHACINVVLDTSSTSITSSSDKVSLSESSLSDSLSEVQLCHDPVNKSFHSPNKGNGNQDCNGQVRKQVDEVSKLNNTFSSTCDPNTSCPITSSEFDEEIVIYRNDLNITSLSGILSVVREALDKKEPLEIPKNHLKSCSVISPSSRNKIFGAKLGKVPSFQTGLDQKVPTIPSSSSVAHKNVVCSTPLKQANQTSSGVNEYVLDTVQQENSDKNNELVQFANVGGYTVQNFVKTLVDDNKHINISENQFELSSSPIIKPLPPISNVKMVKYLPTFNPLTFLNPVRKKPTVILQYPADYIVHKNRPNPVAKRPLMILQFPADYVIHKKQCSKEIRHSSRSSSSIDQLKISKRRSYEASRKSNKSIKDLQGNENDLLANKAIECNVMAKDHRLTNIVHIENEDFKITAPKHILKRTSSFEEEHISVSAVKSWKSEKNSTINTRFNTSNDEIDKNLKISESVKQLLKPVRVVLTRVSIPPENSYEASSTEVDSHRLRNIQKTNKDIVEEPTSYEASPDSISSVEGQMADFADIVEIDTMIRHKLSPLASGNARLLSDETEHAKKPAMKYYTLKRLSIPLTKISLQAPKGKETLGTGWSNGSNNSMPRRSPRKSSLKRPWKLENEL